MQEDNEQMVSEDKRSPLPIKLFFIFGLGVGLSSFFGFMLQAATGDPGTLAGFLVSPVLGLLSGILGAVIGKLILRSKK